MRTKKGLVTSSKMDKTIVVSVISYKNHPKYKKRFKVTSKYYAHDEGNSCLEGDMVLIKEIRPLSKTKRWELVEKYS
jgi:small subunit ribosomal protein S17